MSLSKLYVGNLNYKTTEESLKDLFTQFGKKKPSHLGGITGPSIYPGSMGY